MNTTKKKTKSSSTGKAYRLPPQFGRRELAIAVVVLIIIGFFFVLFSRASTGERVVLEAEKATSASGVSNVTDATASGGAAVALTQGSASTWPAAASFETCANETPLAGPTSAPAGAIVINPGTDLSAQPRRDNTTYYLKAGTHTIAAPIITGTNNVYIGAPGAVLDGQFKANRADGKSIAFDGGYTGVTIKNLTIKNFGASNGRSIPMVNVSPINTSQAKNWTIEGNRISYNGGVGVYAPSGSKVRNNCIENNEQNGVSVAKGSVPATDVLIEGNEIRGNNRADLEAAAGACTGCTSGIKIWDSRRVTVRNNNVSSNKGSGIWSDTNNIDTLIEGNVVKDNLRQGIFVEISYSTIIRNNYLKGNYVPGGAQRGSFPEAAIYISEAGGNAQAQALLGGAFTPEILITGNYIVDNWNGVNLWENASRQCNKNDTADCPPMVTDKSGQCSTTNLTALTANASICRWRTENVRVYRNTFEMTPTASSGWCAPTATNGTNCGRNAINASTDGIGPYAGTSIQNAISRSQNIRFSENNYYGAWKFAIPTNYPNVVQAVWQGTWTQDTGSTFAAARPTPQCGAEMNGVSSVKFSDISLGGGTYQVWARVKKGAGLGTIRVAVDTNPSCTDLVADSANTDWQWVSGVIIPPAWTNLIAGKHSLQIFAVSPGVQLDKVMVLDSALACKPQGMGANCLTPTPTVRLTQTPSPILTPTPTVAPPTVTATPTPTPKPTSTPTPVPITPAPAPAPAASS